jgi:hypothetical protein
VLHHLVVSSPFVEECVPYNPRGTFRDVLGVCGRGVSEVKHFSAVYGLQCALKRQNYICLHPHFTLLTYIF